MHQPDESVILRRWPEIVPLLESNGLEAEFASATKPGETDAIEVRHADAVRGDEIIRIVFADGGWFKAHVWTGSKREEPRTGEKFRTVEAAFEDLIRMLREDGLL